MNLKDRLFSTVFIDFRGETARIVQGRPMDDNLVFTVDSFGSVVLPGHMSFRADDRVLAENAEVLKEFLQKNSMKAVSVVAGLGQSGVVTRIVRVPKISPRDLECMMKLNISDHLPVSPEEYAFDYKVLDEVEDEGGVQSLELMVAAVNRGQAEQCASLLEEAGLKPVVFDILPSMLHRLVAHLPFRDNLVVDSGADGTRLAIFKGKTLFMYADVPFVPGPAGESDFSVLAGELRGYLDYFSSRNFGKTVDGITILGELAGQEDPADLLGQYISLPISVGLSRVGHLKFRGRADGFEARSAVYSGNIGLMMRGSRHQLSVPAPVEETAAHHSGVSLGA
ncbi:MAG: type IV pilus biogenesis protein PilM [Bacillota bacterium]